MSLARYPADDRLLEDVSETEEHAGVGAAIARPPLNSLSSSGETLQTTVSPVPASTRRARSSTVTLRPVAHHRAAGLSIDLAGSLVVGRKGGATRGEIQERVDHDQPVRVDLRMVGCERGDPEARVRSLRSGRVRRRRAGEPLGSWRRDSRGSPDLPIEMALRAQPIPEITVLHVPAAEERVARAARERANLLAVRPASGRDHQPPRLPNLNDRKRRRSDTPRQRVSGNRPSGGVAVSGDHAGQERRRQREEGLQLFSVRVLVALRASCHDCSPAPPSAQSAGSSTPRLTRRNRGASPREYAESVPFTDDHSSGTPTSRSAAT